MVLLVLALPVRGRIGKSFRSLCEGFLIPYRALSDLRPGCSFKRTCSVIFSVLQLVCIDLLRRGGLSMLSRRAVEGARLSYGLAF